MWRDLTSGPSSLLKTFDWEQLVGVKLFSGVAGIALVLAASSSSNTRSIAAGWRRPFASPSALSSPSALLVVCELQRRARYRVTANALDAAAIAILFCDVLRRPLVVEPHSVHADLRAPRRSSPCSRCCSRSGTIRIFIAVLGLRRRLRHAGPAVDRREPADSAVHVPAAAERRPGVGGRPQEVAGADDPDARPHDGVPVGLGRHVSVVRAT